MYVGRFVARPCLIIVKVSEDHVIAVDNRQDNVNRPKAKLCGVLERNYSFDQSDWGY